MKMLDVIYWILKDNSSNCCVLHINLNNTLRIRLWNELTQRTIDSANDIIQNIIVLLTANFLEHFSNSFFIHSTGKITTPGKIYVFQTAEKLSSELYFNNIRTRKGFTHFFFKSYPQQNTFSICVCNEVLCCGVHYK